MTTTLVPSTGAGVAFTQQGQGTTPGYSSLDLRRSDSLGLQEGVYNSTDFMVQQRIAGANMQVEITMTSGGFATVQGDTIAGQGLYTVPVHSANILETIGNADPTNPRVDQIILEVLDNVHDVSGGNRAQTRVVPGTATVGATLSNRTGAAALPSSALLLADVLVGAAAASITNAVIRDRRKWARGAMVRVIRFANAAAGADYGTSSSSFGEIDATNMKPRIECSGAPLRIGLRGRAALPSTAGLSFTAALDGVAADGSGTVDTFFWGSTSVEMGVSLEWITVPAAGTHQVSWLYRSSSSALATLRAQASQPLILTVEEIVRQNTANNATTSG